MRYVFLVFAAAFLLFALSCASRVSEYNSEINQITAKYKTGSFITKGENEIEIIKILLCGLGATVAFGFFSVSSQKSEHTENMLDKKNS